VVSPCHLSAWLAPGSFSIGIEPVAGGRPDDAVSEAASHTRLLLAPVLTRSYAARELPVYFSSRTDLL
jgi:hypothetical protein